MKNIIILIVPLLLYGEIVTLKGDRRDIKLLKESRSLMSSGNQIYYLHGIKSQQTALIDSGQLSVKLLDDTNLSRFASENGLKFLKFRGKRSVFQITDGTDTVLKSNTLRGQSAVYSVEPDWIRVRKLY